MTSQNSDFDTDQIPEYFLDLLLDIALQVLGGQSGSVMLSDSTNYLTIRSSKKLKDEIINRAKVRLGSGVSGKVAVHGRPVYIHGSQGNKDLNIGPDDLTTSRQESAYIAPIQIDNSLLGTVNINNIPPDFQNDPKREYLIQNIIESFTQFLRHRDLSSLESDPQSEIYVANLFREHDSLRQLRILFDYLFHIVTELLKIQKKGLFLVKNIDSGFFDLVLGYGFQTDCYKKFYQYMSSRLKDSNLLSTQEMTIFNSQDISWLPTELIQEPHCLCLPMISQVQSSIYLLIFTEEYPDIKDLDNYILKTICRQAAVSIENSNIASRFRELTFTDSLTATYNYGLWWNRLSEEINRCQRHQINALSVIVFDIDHFDSLNKSCGYFIGDNLLSLIAERIRNHVRKEDIVGRIGGDEFGLILPQTNKEDALMVTDRILTSILTIPEDMNIYSDNELSLSAGISIYPYDAEDPHTLLEKAKTALVSAKIMGGNQVKTYEYEEE